MRKLEGKVITSDDFVVFHRVAISENQLGKGYAKQMMLSIEDYVPLAKEFTVLKDTNHDNGPMKNIFQKLGYVYCGKVYFRGSPRMAYEKVLKKYRLFPQERIQSRRIPINSMK